MLMLRQRRNHQRPSRFENSRRLRQHLLGRSRVRQRMHAEDDREGCILERQCVHIGLLKANISVMCQPSSPGFNNVSAQIDTGHRIRVVG